MSDVDVDPLRVVHVDDDPDIVELAATFLHREDDRIEVESAETADEALGHVEDDHVHCVVSDYGLPDMDLPRFAEVISETAPGVPVVLFTGRDHERLDEGTMGDTVAAYIQKGSGTEQYTDLATAILEAVADADDTAPDGGTVHSSDCRSDGGKETLSSTATDHESTTVTDGDTGALMTDLLDGLGDPAFVLDTDRTVAAWNDRLVDATGEEATTVDGADPATLFADEQSVRDSIDAAAESGMATTDTTLTLPGGDQRPVTLRLTRLTDADDGTVGVLGIADEAAARARLERELDRERERFDEVVGALSHDLRNPLNVVAGRAQLARETGDEEHFEAITRSSDKIEALVDDLVALARAGDPMTDDAVETLDIDETARVVWDRQATDSASLTTESDLTVDGDRGRLKLALEHLFENSLVHGGDDVTVTVGHSDDGFYVADNGPGIEADDRERVLEYGETSDRERGGLGLALARRIVEAHGWSLSLVTGADGGLRVEIAGVETA